MKIKVDIWEKGKISGSYFIACHMELTEADIEEIALQKYKESYDLDEERYEYSANIDEVIH